MNGQRCEMRAVFLLCPLWPIPCHLADFPFKLAQFIIRTEKRPQIENPGKIRVPGTAQKEICTK